MMDKCILTITDYEKSAGVAGICNLNKVAIVLLH